MGLGILLIFLGFGVFPVSCLLSAVQVWLIISSPIMGIKDAFKKHLWRSKV